MHSIALAIIIAITLYIIRRDLAGFDHEKRAGKWRVDGRRTLKEAWQDYVTKRELRRHLRASYRVARSATVRELLGKGAK